MLDVELASPLDRTYETMMREQRDALLSEMTTLGLGGKAARIIDVESEQELAEVMGELDACGEPVMLLGGGSNVVVDDAGWPGTVVRPSLRGIEVHRAEHSVRVRAGAGEVWDELVAQMVEQHGSGLACLSGIPGWSGAAPLQNIGAYGYEVGQVALAGSCLRPARARLRVVRTRGLRLQVSAQHLPQRDTLRGERHRVGVAARCWRTDSLR